MDTTPQEQPILTEAWITELTILDEQLQFLEGEVETPYIIEEKALIKAAMEDTRQKLNAIVALETFKL
jgi:hypothetical protein